MKLSGELKNRYFREWTPKVHGDVFRKAYNSG